MSAICLLQTILVVWKTKNNHKVCRLGWISYHGSVGGWDYGMNYKISMVGGIDLSNTIGILCFHKIGAINRVCSPGRGMPELLVYFFFLTKEIFARGNYYQSAKNAEGFANLALETSSGINFNSFFFFQINMSVWPENEINIRISSK